MSAKSKKIVEATKCKIVLSSTWRYFTNSIKSVNNELKALGLEEIIDRTPSQVGFTRSVEILMWLKK